MHTDEPDPVREQEMIENKVGCILDQIEDVERITGQKFDDEKFVEALKHQWRYREYAGEVCSLIQHIPAPLGQKDLYSFYTLGGLTKTDPAETVALWKMLRDEVKWRTENNIAAVGNERYRWMEHHPPPWHFLKYYRYMEKYGAVCIGSLYSHMMGVPMSGERTAPTARGKPLFRRAFLSTPANKVSGPWWGLPWEAPASSGTTCWAA